MLHPGSRQEDAQRHAVHQATDLRHRGGVVIVQAEAGASLSGALDEQADGVVGGKIFLRGGGWEVEACEMVQDFPLQVELLARSHQDFDLGRVGRGNP